MDEALRARRRNVAWNASSASASLPSEAPQQLRVGQFAHALVEGGPADQLQDRAGRALGHRAVPGKRKRALHLSSSFRRPEEAVFLQRNAPFACREGKGKVASSVILAQGAGCG